LRETALFTRRCPNCQAVNAADAQECSLCGEVFATEAEVEPEPKALTGSRTTEIIPEMAAPATVADEAPAAHFAAAFSASRVVLAAKAAVMGAVTASVLVLAAYGILGVVAYAPLIGRIAAIQPLANWGRAPGALSAVSEAAVLGAIAGGLATFRDTPRLTAVVCGALAAALRAISLLGGTLMADYGVFGLAYGVIQVGVDGVLGGFCGYMASLVVCGYLAAAGQRPSD